MLFSGSPRIASLVPSLTELVCALGLADRLVARTGFCIHPAETVRTIAKVGGTKDVNLAKLKALRPTHVLVNVDENRRETVEAIDAWGADAPRIVVTHPVAPEDNLALVAQMVEAFGAEPGLGARAERLTAELRSELALTRPEGRMARRVLYLIWAEPWMTVARDTYISRLLARIAWQTLPATDGGPMGAARYPALTGAETWLDDVDCVLLSSEPFRFEERHLAAARTLCPRAEIIRVDGEALSWYGARAVTGLRYLRELGGQSAGTNAAWTSSSR